MSPLRGLIRLEMIKAYKHFTATRFLMPDFDKINPDRGDMLIEKFRRIAPNPVGVTCKEKLKKYLIMKNYIKEN